MLPLVVSANYKENQLLAIKNVQFNYFSDCNYSLIWKRCLQVFKR